MALNATVRRRCVGAGALLAALGMLICGRTVLMTRLRDLTFIAYWLVCFALTGMAIVVAFLDARALQRQTRQQQRDLFETTLKQIQSEARTRPRRPSRSRSES